MPKAWLYQDQNKPVDKIDRPVVENEMPIWFYRFEEILEEMISLRDSNLSGRQLQNLRRKAAQKVRQEIDAAEVA